MSEATTEHPLYEATVRTVLDERGERVEVEFIGDPSIAHVQSLIAEGSDDE